MRLFTLRLKWRNLLLCIVFQCAMVGAAQPAELTVRGPLLDGLEYTFDSNETDRVAIETYRWRNLQRRFVPRYGRITVNNVSWNGKREMDAQEPARLARILGPEIVLSAQAEVAIDGPYGHFRIAIFEAENGSQCFVLRSFSGNNWPETYDTFDGRGYPMGSDQLASLYCRQGPSISASEVQSLIDTIQ